MDNCAKDDDPSPSRWGVVVKVAICCSIGLGVRILRKPLLARLMRGRDTPSINPAPTDGEQQTTATSSIVQEATSRPPSASILSPPAATTSPLPAVDNQPSPAGNSTPHTAATTLLPAAATLPLRAAAITPPATASTPPLSPLSPHSPQAGTPRIAVSVATPLKVHLTPPATLVSEVPASVMRASVMPATALLASALPASAQPTSAPPTSALPASELPAFKLPVPALPVPPPALPAPAPALPALAPVLPAPVLPASKLPVSKLPSPATKLPAHATELPAPATELSAPAPATKLHAPAPELRVPNPELRAPKPEVPVLSAPASKPTPASKLPAPAPGLPALALPAPAPPAAALPAPVAMPSAPAPALPASVPALPVPALVHRLPAPAPAPKLPASALALPAPAPVAAPPAPALPASVLSVTAPPALPATAPPAPLLALAATRAGTVAATYAYLVQNCAGVVVSRGVYVYPGGRCFPVGLPNCNLRVVAGSAADWHWPAPADRLAAVRLYTLAGGKLCARIGEYSATFKPLVQVQSQSSCAHAPVRANIDGRRVRCFDQGDAVAAVFARALNVISARLVHVEYDGVGVGQGAAVPAGMNRRHIRILVTPRFAALADVDDAKRALVVAYKPDVLFEYAGEEIEQLRQLVPGSVMRSANGALRVLSIKPMRHPPAALAGKPVYLLLAYVLGETRWTLRSRDSFSL